MLQQLFTLDGKFHLWVYSNYDATYTSGGNNYAATVTGDVLTISQPFNPDTVALTSGKHSYSDIAYGLLTLNALTVYNGLGGENNYK